MLGAGNIAMRKNATQNLTQDTVGMKPTFLWHWYRSDRISWTAALFIDTLYRMREIQEEKEAIGGL